MHNFIIFIFESNTKRINTIDQNDNKLNESQKVFYFNEIQIVFTPAPINAQQHKQNLATQPQKNDNNKRSAIPMIQDVNEINSRCCSDNKVYV